MGKVASTNSTDAALNYIKNAVEREVVCSAEPSSYANVSSVALADVALTSSDVTVGAGTGGRQYQVAQKSSVNIDTTGTATHVCLVDDSASELLDITTCPSTAVSSGGTLTIASWTRTINDAT